MVKTNWRGPDTGCPGLEEAPLVGDGRKRREVLGGRGGRSGEEEDGERCGEEGTVHGVRSGGHWAPGDPPG